MADAPKPLEGGNQQPIQDAKTSKPWVAKAAAVGTVALVLIGLLAQLAGSHGLSHVGSLSMQSIQSMAEKGAIDAAIFTILAGVATIINEARKKAKIIPRTESRVVELNINGKEAKFFGVYYNAKKTDIDAIEKDIRLFQKSNPSEEMINLKLEDLNSKYHIDVALAVGSDIHVASKDSLVRAKENEQDPVPTWYRSWVDEGEAVKAYKLSTKNGEACILGSTTLYNNQQLELDIRNANQANAKDSTLLKNLTAHAKDHMSLQRAPLAFIGNINN